LTLESSPEEPAAALQQAPTAPPPAGAAGEAAGLEEATALLTAMLDRLGAAHHRPFSRA